MARGLEGLRGSRRPDRWLVVLFSAAAFVLALYTGYWGGLPNALQVGLYFAVALPLIYLTRPFRSSPMSLPGRILADYLPAAISVGVGLYFAHSYNELVIRMMFGFNVLDYAVAILAIIVVLEATRRTLGIALPILVILLGLYALFGNMLPGPWGHRGFDLLRVVSYVSLTLDGLFGVPFQAAATYVLVFVFFGAFLEATGAGDFIISAANYLVGRFRGGPAKVAVIGSGTFGTISGSAVANVAGTGTFTIPAMKQAGYDPSFAAAVEAVASTGGQLMPPVMGAAAFIMAEMLGLPYARVASAAILPAILYYLACFVAVDLEAAKKGLKGVPPQNRPPLHVVLGGWAYLLPLVVLIVLLFFVQWSALRSVFASLIVLLILAALRAWSRFPWLLAQGVMKGATSALEAAAATACAGLLVGVFSLTGLGLKLSALLVGVSGGHLALLLMLVALACLVLGMGVPTTPAYIMVAITVAPALTKMGVEPLAAHLFVFWYAIIAVVTPPVAVAAYVAAGLAESNPWKTGFTAFRLAVPGFLVPFMLTYRPAVLLNAKPLEVVGATVVSMLGMSLLAVSLSGFLTRTLSWGERFLGLAAAVVLIWPGRITDIVGLILAALFAVVHFGRLRATTTGQSTARVTFRTGWACVHQRNSEGVESSENAERRGDCVPARDFRDPGRKS